MEQALLLFYLSPQARLKRQKKTRTVGTTTACSYMQVKRRKLREQYLSLGERQSNIFAGATIYVNGYTQPEADELKRMVQAHGGGYEYMPYSSRITHVIATNLPAAKIRRGLSRRRPTVCKPAWIVDSVRAGEQLPVKQYELYNIASKGQQQLRSKKTAWGTADIRSLFSSQHSLSHQPQIISSARVKSKRVGDEHQEADSVHPDLAADYSGGLDLPPASQLDYDVLLELPANLQDRILESYTKRANQILPSSHSVDSGIVPVMKTNPALDSSRMVTAGDPDEDCLIESASTTNSGRILIEDQEKFVAEMREKIRHWIATSPNGPDSHDLDTFSNFLVDLCPQNIVVTELALKCFRRSTTHQGMAVWYPMFNSVLARVQGVESRCYSGVLAIDPIAL